MSFRGVFWRTIFKLANRRFIDEVEVGIFLPGSECEEIFRKVEEAFNLSGPTIHGSLRVSDVTRRAFSCLEWWDHEGNGNRMHG